VQALLTLGILLVLPSPVRSFVGPAAIAVVAAGIVLVVLVERVRPHGRSWWARLRRGAARDIRAGLLARRALPVVVVTSAVVVLGHAAAFLIAARTAGATASTAEMLPLAMLAMLGMVVPGIAGWGPREGVAAWVFGAAGLGANTGVATAVVYGVMALVASLPGALVIIGEGLTSALHTDGVTGA
jgi:hypothetical protein